MSRWNKLIKSVVLLMAIFVIVAGCTNSEVAEVAEDSAPAGEAASAEEAASGENLKMKIGIMTMGLSQDYFVDLSQGYKDAAAAFPGVDVEIIEVDPKFDVAEQVAAIENFIVLDADAIIVTAIDPEVLTPVVQDAMKAGVKVIAHYNILGAQDMHSGISTYGMGYIAGQQAAEWINESLGGSTEVGLLIWEKTEFDIDRTLGMRDAIAQFAPNSKIVAEVAADTQVDGLAVTETMLQAHPDIRAIVCYNGDGCLGALGAVEASGIDTDSFGIFGVGASGEELAKISEGGAYRGTSSIAPYQHGMLEMEMAIRLVRGDFLPVSMEINPVPVDITNVAEYMK